MSRAAASSLRRRSIISRSTSTGRVCLDVGASTGGFTEVLLVRGARASMPSMSARPAARTRCAAALRSCRWSKPISARSIRRACSEPPDFATVDVSFISLKLVLPAIGKLLAPRANLVALIKPQFEAARRDIKKGIVRDAAVHAAGLRRHRAHSSPRSAGASAARSLRRSPAATATANSSSRPSVVERSSIDRHRPPRRRRRRGAEGAAI